MKKNTGWVLDASREVGLEVSQRKEGRPYFYMLLPKYRTNLWQKRANKIQVFVNDSNK